MRTARVAFWCIVITVTATIVLYTQWTRLLSQGILPSECAGMQSNLVSWRHLANYRPSQEAMDSIVRWRRELVRFTSVQSLSDGYGPVNLDYFPIVIQTLPIVDGRRLNAAEFLVYLRTNLGTFLDPAIAVVHVDDAEALKKGNPTVVRFDIITSINLGVAKARADFETAAVFLSDSRENRWVFTTIFDLSSLDHPVSGNREFGYFRRNDGAYVFYTRGVDRTSGIRFDLFRFDVFSNAELLWEGWQSKVNAFVNTHYGKAEPALLRAGTRPTTVSVRCGARILNALLEAAENG